MNGCDFTLAGERLTLMPSGALWWGAARLLVVSDLHLGKSERAARRHGAMLPPYESRDTLARLAGDLDATRPETVISLGDAFDDDAAAAALPEGEARAIAGLQQGRRWVWIAGNHDPAAACHGGDCAPELALGPLTFRHIAEPGAQAELSGHYHPKARIALRGRMISRPCLLTDGRRAILPAYGTYTGGLDAASAPLARLMTGPATAILTGPRPVAIPLTAPRRRAAAGPRRRAAAP